MNSKVDEKAVKAAATGKESTNTTLSSLCVVITVVKPESSWNDYKGVVRAS